MEGQTRHANKQYESHRLLTICQRRLSPGLHFLNQEYSDYSRYWFYNCAIFPNVYFRAILFFSFFLTKDEFESAKSTGKIIEIEGQSKDQKVKVWQCTPTRPDELRTAMAKLLTRICPLCLKVAAVTKELENIS